LALVVSKLERLVPFETCVVYLSDATGGSVVAQHVAGINVEDFRGRGIRQGEGVTGWVLANNKPFANTDPTLDFSALGCQPAGYRTLAVYPLLKGDRTLGALAVYSQKLSSYSVEQLHMLEQVAGLTADAIHKATLYAETRDHDSGLTDQLTDLPNARYFYAFFEQEQVRAADDVYPLVLMTMEVDDFRDINETIGQTNGDKLLKEVAELIRVQLRREDMLIRYAGGKFIALFRNTAAETIREIAVRVQTSISFHRSAVVNDPETRFGISIGQARLKEDGVTLEELLDEAERRLHANKAGHESFQKFANTSEVMMISQ
nr:sensor domain-containing diguanylate cyclase [Acidobacteriota bacterium]